MKHILQCEDTIAGIFSAVYCAWEYRFGHENTVIALIRKADMDTPELFAEYHLLVPDTRKAQKVLETIRRSCGYAVYESLFFAAYADAVDKADTIYRYVQRALDMGKMIQDHLTAPEVVRIMELSREVKNERHYYLGFLRFIEIPGSILLAKYEPKNRVTELIMPHFAERYPEERFIIWDVRRNEAGVYKPGQRYLMITFTEEEKKRLLSYREIHLDAELLWKDFVKAVSIRERDNRELQKSNIPLHFRKYMTEFGKEGPEDGVPGQSRFI